MLRRPATTVLAYGTGVIAVLAQPFAFVVGQLVTFFGLSLYVKFVEMRLSTEYAAAWLESGNVLRNSFHFVLFCGQEVAVFAVLLCAIAVWQRYDPLASRGSRCALWVLGLVILPVLSTIEVLGVGHFALFLTSCRPATSSKCPR